MKLSYSSGNLARHTQDFTRDQKILDEYRWTFQKIDDLKILERVKSEGIPLKEYVNNNVYRGIVTGFNTAFIIDAATRKKLITDDRRSAEIIKPYLAGEDVKRYAINSKKRYIVFTRRGIDIERNPAVKKHLEQFRAE